MSAVVDMVCRMLNIECPSIKVVECLKDDAGLYYPGSETIVVSASSSHDVDYVLLHELGHHIHQTCHSDIEWAANLLYTDSELLVSDYASTSNGEAWAEAFAYYCCYSECMASDAYEIVDIALNLVATRFNSVPRRRILRELEELI